MPAAVAAYVDESMGKDAALEVRPQLALDELRNDTTAGLRHARETSRARSGRKVTHRMPCNPAQKPAHAIYDAELAAGILPRSSTTRSPWRNT